MKQFQALIAATLTTILIGLGMLAIGLNATSNPDSVPVSNSPAQAATVSTTAAPDPAQAQIDQLQNLIKQYQDREKQYQSELSTMSQKLSDATAQADQLQQVLMALQERGVIQITRDGRILIPQG